MTKYKEIKTLAGCLEQLDAIVEDMIRDIKCSYECVGKKQAKDLRGELLWEDEEQTVPKMTSKWDYVPKAELSEDDKAVLDAWDKIRKNLEKML